MRELFRLLNFIDDSGADIVIASPGMQAASYADAAMDNAQTEFWRRAIRAIRHHGNDAEASHPYQVLLKLVARRPGITRAMCALALEAKNDSDSELERIAELAGRPEDDARRITRASRSNWNNAKKILPKFAEQLGDVIKTGQTFRIADAPGRAADAGPAAPPAERRRRAGPAAPRTARAVTADTVARAGTAEARFDDVTVPVDIDAASAAEAVAARRERLRRHNLLVRALASRLTGTGRQLFEDPFDLLALFARIAILSEVKTLDGSANDERDRVRDALAQLLYYEAFVTRPVAGGSVVRKVACFECAISDEHRRWLNDSNIAVIWREQNRFCGDVLAEAFLGDYMEELRRSR